MFLHEFGKNVGDDMLTQSIVPLGASITQGWDAGITFDLHNGYRKPLRQHLRSLGYPVNMVGSRAQGDFFDRQHEGWPGFEIDQVALKMLLVLTTQKPNLVLILLGSNDCFHAQRDSNMEYARSTKNRMRSLLERVFAEVKDTTVILATLPPTLDPSNEPYFNMANSGYKDLARELREQGRKIELADMYTTWLLPEDYSDSIHFKSSGYTKLAAMFAKAFSNVEAKGWLTPPLDTGIPDNSGCYPSQSGFRGPVLTQRGSGHDDGDFTYSSKLENSKDFSYAEAAPLALLAHFHFANIIKLPDEYHPWDELIRVLDQEDRRADNLPFVSYFTNKGHGNFDKVSTTIEVGQECSSQDVRLADFNGDGLDDFICLDGVSRVQLCRMLVY
jgi:lysophospholipase L1-like esterase